MRPPLDEQAGHTIANSKFVGEGGGNANTGSSEVSVLLFVGVVSATLPGRSRKVTSTRVGKIRRGGGLCGRRTGYCDYKALMLPVDGHLKHSHFGYRAARFVGERQAPASSFPVGTLGAPVCGDALVGSFGCSTCSEDSSPGCASWCVGFKDGPDAEAAVQSGGKLVPWKELCRAGGGLNKLKRVLESEEAETPAEPTPAKGKGKGDNAAGAESEDAKLLRALKRLVLRVEEKQKSETLRQRLRDLLGSFEVGHSGEKRGRAARKAKAKETGCRGSA